MKTQKIIKTLLSYFELEDTIEKFVIEKLNKLDSKCKVTNYNIINIKFKLSRYSIIIVYNTSSQINEIEYEEYEFPMDYLEMSDDKLIKAIKDKNERI